MPLHHPLDFARSQASTLPLHMLLLSPRTARPLRRLRPISRPSRLLLPVPRAPSSRLLSPTPLSAVPTEPTASISSCPPARARPTPSPSEFPISAATAPAVALSPTASDCKTTPTKAETKDPLVKPRRGCSSASIPAHQLRMHSVTLATGAIVCTWASHTRGLMSLHCTSGGDSDVDQTQGRTTIAG